MFDTVHFKCPDCGEDMKIQSKAGPCLLNNYPSTSMPAEIAKSIKGEYIYCHKGGHSHRIEGEKFVSLELEQ